MSTTRIARASAAHPIWTIAIWIALLLVSGGLVVTMLAGGLTTDQDITNDPEYGRAERLIAERFPGFGGIRELLIVKSTRFNVDQPEYRQFVSGLSSKLNSLGGSVVQSAVSYYDAGDELLLSNDRRATLVRVLMAGNLAEAIDHVGILHAIADQLSLNPDFDIFEIGRATTGKDFTELSERDLQKGELFALPIALVILVLVFGAFAAALLPITLAAVAIVVAMGASALVAQTMDLSFFVVNMITMMGLAVGIDYSLFILSRYREERANGREKLDAISAAGATAGRAVFFSGLTVVVALAGLLLVPVNVFRSLSIGAILVVLAAIVASMTLLPAVLSLLGDRVNALQLPFIRRISAERHRDREEGIWDRITRTVMGRPLISLILAASLLLVVTAPFLNIRTGSAGVSTLPEELRSRQGLTVLGESFSAGLVSPVQIVVDGDMTSPAVQQAVERLRRELQSDRDVGGVALAISPARNAALLSAVLKVESTDAKAAQALRRIRQEIIPRSLQGVAARALVTGITAQNVEFFDVSAQYTPVVFGFVLTISFLLLMVVFRSLVIPLKAILMNLLSVGAAYGLIVLVSQEGFGADLLGFQQVDAVEAWIPMFLFAVLFGLSMDYHVFMLTRIRERFDATGDNTESVSYGLRRTGGLITGAAAIMVAVFGGFAAGDLVMFQQLGFGLAVAVFLDATVVRSVLVPASMKLLGKRNWYLPRGLRWLPELQLEGGSEHRNLTVGVEASAHPGS